MMKYFSAVIGLLFSFTGLEAQEIDRYLDSLHRANEFFKLENALVQNRGKTSPKAELYYTALVDNAFNRLTKSIWGIDKLFAEYNAALTDSQKMVLYTAQVFNLLKLPVYSQAGEWVGKAMAHALVMKDSATYLGFKNMKNITDALTGTAPPTIDLHGEVRLKYKRDKAGLITLPVRVNNAEKSTRYIFDSGANISVITTSEAEKNNVKQVHNGLEISGITGNKIQSGMGVADSFKIGGITLRNVAFLVLPDEMLTIRAWPFVYRIKGIIGYPVLQLLREIQITKKEVIIPEYSSPKDMRNLAMVGYTPIVNVQTETGDSLSFMFDSGAKITLLFNNFYKRYNHLFPAKAKTKTITVAGAGGKEKIKVQKLKRLMLTAGGASATLKKVPVYLEKTSFSPVYYGIIGQDYIKKFKKTTLNFERMYISFE